MILLFNEKTNYSLYLYYLKQKIKIKYIEDILICIVYLKGFFGYVELNVLKNKELKKAIIIKILLK